MTKYFIFTDVHSFGRLMLEKLAENGFDRDNPEHIFVSLGDLLDRGDETADCLEFIASLPPERMILIRGNHEDLMDMCLNAGSFTATDYYNDTSKSVMDLTGIYDDDAAAIKAFKMDQRWKYYESQLIDYKEFPHTIFAHGWIPVSIVWEESNDGDLYDYAYNPAWRDASKEEWNQARWHNGIQMAGFRIIEPGKTIYCGHVHTSFGHRMYEYDGLEFCRESVDRKTINEKCNFDPFYMEGIVAMDACTAYSGKMNCIVLDEEEV